jgi:hypothetical protein
MPRTTKKAANYTPEAKMHSERCGLCEHFFGSHSCEIVVGFIDRDAWCKYFKRKALKNGKR